MAIAKLSVDLEARMATFERNLKEAERLADGAANHIVGAFREMAPQIASAFSGAALVSFTKSAIDAADAFNDLSQKTGVDIKTLAAYQLAAEQSGTGMEAVAKGMKSLSTEMVKNGDALKAAGIDAKDADGALRQIADLFSKMPDGVEKSAIASELFGSKLGTELIPMLNLGAEGLDESAAASGRYAAAMLATAPAADALNDTVAELGINTKAMVAELAIGLLPTLQGVANEMLRGSKETGGFSGAGKALATVLQTISVLGAEVSYVFTAIGTDIAYMVEQAGALATLDFSRFASLGEQARESAATARAEVDALTSRLLNPPPLTLPEVEKPAADLEKYRKQWEALLKAMTDAGKAKPPRVPRAVAQRQASFTDYDQQLTQKIASAIEKTDIVKAAELVRQLQKLDELAAAGLDPAIVAAVRDDLSGAAKAAADELARLNKLLDETPTAKLEAVRDDMQFMTAALEKGRISEEQYLEAVVTRLDKTSEKTKEVADEMDEFSKAAAKNIQDTLADFLFDPFADGLDGMAKKWVDVIRRMAAEALAANLAKAMFGDMGKTGEVGGWVGSAFKLFSGAVGLPSFDVGTDYVPRDMVAQIHKGERIVPAAQNRPGQQAAATTQNIRIVNAFDNSVIGDYLGSSAGEKIIMNAVQRNAGAFRQALA